MTKEDRIKLIKAGMDNISDVRMLEEAGGLMFFECDFVNPVKDPLGRVNKNTVVCVANDGTIRVVPR